MRGHGLGVFEGAASLEIGGDAGRAKHVTAELALEPSFGGAPADHLVGVDTVHRPICKNLGSAQCRAKEGGLAALANTGGIEIFVEELFELVMCRHFVALPAFLVQAQPPALAIGK